MLPMPLSSLKQHGWELRLLLLPSFGLPFTSSKHQPQLLEEGLPILMESETLWQSILLLFILTAVYGTSHGLVEGAEKALIAELAGGKGKGKAFGLYNMLIGFAALIASATFGVVWDRFGSEVAFCASGAFALIAAVVLLYRCPKA
jgi:MFS family permease